MSDFENTLKWLSNSEVNLKNSVSYSEKRIEEYKDLIRDLLDNIVDAKLKLLEIERVKGILS